MLASSSLPPLALHQRLWRLLRHLWFDERDRRAAALPPEAVERLRQQVAASEARQSAEIRISLEASLPASYAWRQQPLQEVVRARALSQFAKLRVWDTEGNNGVLVYLLLPEHAIEIIADRAAARAVPAGAWQAVIEHMRPLLRQGHIEQALAQAVADIGALLEPHFPPPAQAAAPRNELPDRPDIA